VKEDVGHWFRHCLGRSGALIWGLVKSNVNYQVPEQR